MRRIMKKNVKGKFMCVNISARGNLAGGDRKKRGPGYEDGLDTRDPVFLPHVHKNRMETSHCIVKTG